MEPHSVVWEHFTEYTNKDGERRAHCNYCLQDYAADSALNGTAAVKNHMKGCMKNPYNNEAYATQVKQQSSTHGSKTASVVNWRLNQDDARKACAYMIIVDGLPFSFVENQGFRHFMSVVCPAFQIPSRSSISRDIYELYLEEKAKLKGFLKQSSKRISLTIDSWTSEQSINYLCLTAHIVDDNWILHKKILNFCPIDSHKGDAVGKGVERCLIDWGIDNIFTITVNNASSNDITMSYLKNRLPRRGTNLLGGKHLHVRCIAHIINLVVTDGLKEIMPSIDRVRAAVRYIKQSPSRLRKFEACVYSERIESTRSLYLDVPTRWNSTYLMLDTALTLKKAFERIGDPDPHYKCDLEIESGELPSEDDWHIISHFLKFLGHFYDLTLRISGSLYVTSNQVLHELSDVVMFFNAWADTDDVELREMAMRMREKYNKYWGRDENLNFLIFYAVILDPRFKLHYVGWVINRMYPNNLGLIESVKEGFYALFEEYRKLNSPQVSRGSSLFHSSGHSFTGSMSCGSEDLHGRPSKKRFLGVDTRHEYEMFLTEIGGIFKNEFEKYNGEEREKDQEGFDILKWWELNASRFPILAEMARDILAVPFSTVASESAFSVGNRVLDTFRSSLPPRMVQGLMCVKDWLRNEATPVSIEEDIDVLEKMDKEFRNYAREFTIIDI